MPRRARLQRSILVALIVALAYTTYLAVQQGRETFRPTMPAASSPATQAVTTEDEHVVLYIPAGLAPGKRYPMVITFSPAGDAWGTMHPWKEIADRRLWIVAASKEFRNGLNMEPLVEGMHQRFREIVASRPVDPSRVAATGLSGGGMASHAFSYLFPDLISAVIVNTGKIHESFLRQKGKYPKKRLAVLLASPTDFRYREMRRDRAFLESLDWRVRWLEFPGGHATAPRETYEEAALWLEREWERR